MGLEDLTKVGRCCLEYNSWF